jgi:hypothetical protein
MRSVRAAQRFAAGTSGAKKWIQSVDPEVGTATEIVVGSY